MAAAHVAAMRAGGIAPPFVYSSSEEASCPPGSARAPASPAGSNAASTSTTEPRVGRKPSLGVTCTARSPRGTTASSPVRDAGATQNHFSSFVVGIVKSPAFRMSRVDADTHTP